MSLAAFVGVLLLLAVKGCEIHLDRQILDAMDFRRGVELRVDDTSLAGELVATFQVVSTGDVTLRYPEDGMYLRFVPRDDNRYLDVVLTEQFEKYEYFEYSAVQHLGFLLFSCSDAPQPLHMRVRLKVIDSNNHPPEFLNPEDYTFLVQLPVLARKSLLQVALGPEIAAFDVDLTNRNISFRVFGAERMFEARYVRREHSRYSPWPLHFVDIRTRVKLTAERTSFQLIAMDKQDKGPPSLLGSVTITIIGTSADYILD